MILVTICNEPWLDKHLVRWIRHAKKYSNLPLGLIYTGDMAALDGYRGSFDKISIHSKEEDCRDWYNKVRMGATELFNDEVLYLDCDCDIMGDLSGIGKEIPAEAELGFCMSPAYHDDWVKLVYEKYRGQELWEANNGLLLLRKDWSNEYADSFADAVKTNSSPRILGTIAFNMMLREKGETTAEIPYRYSVIWHDYKAIASVMPVTLQYCNSQGQAKRVELEREYRRWHGYPSIQ